MTLQITLPLPPNDVKPHEAKSLLVNSSRKDCQSHFLYPYIASVVGAKLEGVAKRFMLGVEKREIRISHTVCDLCVFGVGGMCKEGRGK